MTAERKHLWVELSRKSIHMTSGLVPLSYALWDHRVWTLAILGVMSGTMLALEFLRRRQGIVKKIFHGGFDFMLRKHEQDGPHWLGATHYCLAALLCVALFARPIAVLGLFNLAVGDTAASLVGKAFGRIKIGNKSLEGTLAFGIACSAVAILCHALSPAYPLAAGIIAAWVAALAELYVSAFDDNWTIPITTCVTIWLIGVL